MLKGWQLWLGAGVSALFLIIALYGLKLDDVWQSLLTAQYIWLFPGVIIYFLAVWARVWRWHYLLRPVQVIPLSKMWSPVVIGYMGNNIFPFRAGEVIRAYVLRRKANINMSIGLVTVIVERIFDGLTMLIFVLVGLPRIPQLPLEIKQTIILASLVFSIVLIVLGLWALKPKQAEQIYTYLIDKFMPARMQRTVLELADNFTIGLKSLSNLQDLLMIFVTSIVIWLLETIKYWFVMHAFAFSVSFFALMLMNGVVNLATTLPTTPGYIGTFDLPGIRTLVIFGIDQAVATSYTLVLHAALWFPITFLGFWYMGKEGFSWREFQQVAASKDEQHSKPTSIPSQS